jgi:5-formyltetrahydrofolate cyclo-ligase
LKKSELRKKYKQLRNELTAQEISERSLDISDLLMESFDLNDKHVHVFLPIFDKKEINTWLTVDRLMSISKVVVSRSDFETYTMEHVLLEKDVPIETNSWGIPEPVGGDVVLPEQLNFVLVPLLAYDKKGYRVGYGKGFYDKFLTELPKETIKIGLSFFEVENEMIETNSYDKKLDFCVTPNNLYTFE